MSQKRVDSNAIQELSEAADLLTKEEEVRLAYLSAQGDITARHHMAKANLRLVISIAKHYQGKGIPLKDLIGYGNIGLMEAVERFDPSRGYRFSTYATYWIKRVIRKELMSAPHPLQVSAYAIKVLNRWYARKAILAEQFGREPTFDEIATDLSFRKSTRSIVKNALQLYGPERLPRFSFETDTGQFSAVHQLSNNDNSVLESVEKKDLLHLLGKAMQVLEERETRVITLRFGLEGEPAVTLREIGEVLGISHERVRQIEKDALGKLARYFQLPYTELRSRLKMQDAENSKGKKKARSA